jgi:hypothetical protein
MLKKYGHLRRNEPNFLRVLWKMRLRMRLQNAQHGHTGNLQEKIPDSTNYKINISEKLGRLL